MSKRKRDEAEAEEDEDEEDDEFKPTEEAEDEENDVSDEELEPEDEGPKRKKQKLEDSQLEPAKPTPSSPTQQETSQTANPLSSPPKPAVQVKSVLRSESILAAAMGKAKPTPATPTTTPTKPSGLSSVLGALSSGKKKPSTMLKSAQDWERYKKESGLEAELEQHNRNGGYLEKVAFLQRADQRQFEIEREIRMKRRMSALAKKET